MQVPLIKTDYEVRCGDTGYFMGMQYLRFSNSVYLRHDTIDIGPAGDPKKSHLCWCSAGTRDFKFIERAFIFRGWHPDVLIWAVAWSKDWNKNEIAGLGNTKDLIRRFLLMQGAIAYVDGQPTPRVVKVEFGKNRFARDD